MNSREGAKITKVWHVLLGKLNQGQTTFTKEDISDEDSFGGDYGLAQIQCMESDGIVRSLSEKRYEILVDIGTLRSYILKCEAGESKKEDISADKSEITYDEIISSTWELKDAHVELVNDSDEDDEESKNRREYLEKRRRELIRRMQSEVVEIGFDDDDDNEDDDDDEEDEDAQIDDEELGLKALKFCIDKGVASCSLLMRTFHIGYIRASKLLDWMENIGYISEAQGSRPRKVLITQEEFDRRYGEPSLIEDEDFIDEEDENDEDDEANSNLRQILTDCVMNGFFENNEKKFVLDSNGNVAFLFEFINDGSELRISDAGETFKSIHIKRRRVRNILKGYDSVALGEDNVISVTLDNSSGTLLALFNLYAAIDAIKKADNADSCNKKIEEIRRLCNVLHQVVEQKASVYERECEASEELTIDTLYSKDFNMQAVIASIPDIDEKIEQIEKDGMSQQDIRNSHNEDHAFESICMDVIDSIVKINSKWKRRDAIRQAAKELIAVQNGKQRQLVIDIHRRVYIEFTIASDDEYEALRRAVWEN